LRIEIENRATMERYNDASDGRRRRLKRATAAARTDRAPAVDADAASDASCDGGVEFALSAVEPCDALLLLPSFVCSCARKKNKARGKKQKAMAKAKAAKTNANKQNKCRSRSDVDGVAHGELTHTHTPTQTQSRTQSKHAYTHTHRHSHESKSQNGATK